MELIENFKENWEAIALFSGLGALTWAIRGTTGWGGFDGAVLPGMIWALLLYRYLGETEWKLGRASFLFGFGIAIGGMWGYGVYVPWIWGDFVIEWQAGIFLEIHPAIGYFWFFLTGFIWGAPAIILFCWSIWPATKIEWVIRLVVPALFCLLFFLIKAVAPDMVYPFISTGIYEQECVSCTRSLETSTVNVLVFLWSMGALITEFSMKNRKAAYSILLVSVLFGIAFALSAAWCLLFQVSNFTDWWKMWELTMGFLSGLIVFMFMKLYARLGAKEPEILESKANSYVGMNLSIFAYFGMALYGLTSRLGSVLDLYAEDFDQYDVPPARLVLVLLLLIPFLIWFFLNIKNSAFELSNRFLIQTACFTGFVGITTIWPSNLVVLYFLLFWWSIVPIVLKLEEQEEKKRLSTKNQFATI